MAWKRFDRKKPTGPKLRKPAASITKDWAINLNTLAVLEYGFNDVIRVSLWYNEEADQIGLRKEADEDYNLGTYSLSRSGGTRGVRAVSFAKAYNLNKHLGTYPIEVIGEMLVITLNKEKEVTDNG